MRRFARPTLRLLILTLIPLAAARPQPARGQESPPAAPDQNAPLVLPAVPITVPPGADPKPDKADPPGAGRPKAEPGSQPKEAGVATGWDDGFYLRSADKRFSLRVTG